MPSDCFCGVGAGCGASFNPQVGVSPGEQMHSGAPHSHHPPEVACPAKVAGTMSNSNRVPIAKNRFDFISHLSFGLERQIEVAAELAGFGRDQRALEKLAGGGLGCLSLFCEAIGLNRQGECERAEEIARSLVEGNSGHYRAKGLALLAHNRAATDPDRALALYRAAARCCDDPYTALTIYQMKAVVLSGVEDHQRALHVLESGVCLLPAVRRVSPARDQFLNSLAVECTFLGHFQQASQLCKITAVSPWLGRYPEWQETITSLKQVLPNHSLVTFSAPPHRAQVLPFFPRVPDVAAPTRLGLLQLDARIAVKHLADERLLGAIAKFGKMPVLNREVVILAPDLSLEAAQGMLDSVDRAGSRAGPLALTRKERR